jgi:nucleoside-diphosphate-sugar epimerase
MGSPAMSSRVTDSLPARRLGVGEEDLWPAVHRLDAARLFRLAVEAAPAGSRLHGAAEEGVPFKDIAEAIGRQLKLPVVSITAEEAGDHFGFLAAFVSFDNPTSSALTRERLGWRPEGPALIPDIEKGHYFND